MANRRSTRRAVLLIVGLISSILIGSACAPLASSVPDSPPLPTLTATTPPVAPPTATIPPLPVAPADRTLNGEIVIDGSSTVFPITEAAATAFRSQVPGVQIRLGVSGTGGGFSKFCAGELAIADASRPIKQEEIAACAANQIAFVELPVAFDGISVVVHAENRWAGCMTVSELRRLWEPQSTQTITQWSQLRTNWPAQPIALYGAGSDSGTYDYFTSAIVGSEGISRSDYVGSEDDYVLAQNVANNRLGLGFFGYAYYREYQDRLRLVAIDAEQGAGCVQPNETTIADGSYQPLSRPIFIYVRHDALERREVQAFVRFYLENASLFVQQARYVPLTPTLYRLVLQRAEQGRVGSVFQGGSQVGMSLESLLVLEER